MPDLLTLTVQIAVIIGAASVVALVFRKIGQPRVVGEMFSGIMLGPSLLGWLAPQLSAMVFPASSLGFLNALSQVGIVIYMFLVGLAINTEELRHHGRTMLLMSHVSITAPLFLGAWLGIYAYPLVSADDVSFTAFALFVGAAMSITAFPVLARILTDRQLMDTKIGSLAIACAAVDDVTGWSILASIVFFMRARQDAQPLLWVTLAGLALFLALMFSAAHRALRRFGRLYARDGRLSDNALGIMMLLVLLSAAATEQLGLHLLFGSFLMGVVMPKDKLFVSYIQSRFETVTVVILLPLYFSFTGLRTSIHLIDGAEMWTLCALIVVVATVGKFGGSMLAARCTGCSWRESAALGSLMNTRGLMELVILNIGLDIGVISPALYSMMVLMALATTFMTVPLFDWINPLAAASARHAETKADQAV